MNAHGTGSRNDEDGSLLGTLGWVGVVVVGAVLALLFLSRLGPVGAH